MNEDKTRICRVPEASFDFWANTFGVLLPQDGKAYLGTTPSKKSIKQICEAIHAETGRHTMTQSADKLVKKLNAKLSGWANYFRLGPVSPAYQAVDAHAPSAAPVVMQKAPGSRQRDHSLPRPVPLRNFEAGSIAGADAQPAVGEGMSACPRAGCAKRASPVR